MNISIIIQGPLNTISLSNLEFYKKIGDVIISYWDTDDESLLDKYNIDDVKLIKNHLSPDFIKYWNNHNVYYQILTTYNALKEVKDRYVIKTRSDNKFEFLKPFIESMIKDPDKLICSNNNFRPIGYAPFHSSDNLLGGRTDLLLKTFELCKYRLENDQMLLMAGIFDETTYYGLKKDYKRWKIDIEKPYTNQTDEPIIGVPRFLFNQFIGVLPETLITTSFLMSKGIQPNIDDEKQLLCDNINIINVEDLKYTNKKNNSMPEFSTFQINSIEEINKINNYISVKFFTDKDTTKLTTYDIYLILYEQLKEMIDRMEFHKFNINVSDKIYLSSEKDIDDIKILIYIEDECIYQSDSLNLTKGNIYWFSPDNKDYVNGCTMKILKNNELILEKEI